MADIDASVFKPITRSDKRSDYQEIRQASAVPISQAEIRSRARQSRCNRADKGSEQAGAQSVGNKVERTDTQRRKPSGKHKWLTLADVRKMTESLLSLSGRLANDPDRKPSDRKQDMVSYAVITDKWLTITGRPTQIVQVKEGEEHRPALRNLADKIRMVA